MMEPKLTISTRAYGRDAGTAAESRDSCKDYELSECAA